MKKFLIEVAHENDKKACEDVIRVFLNTGSHFLTHADWGCKDGEHKAWIILEAESKTEAKSIVPPAYRRDARVIELTRFTLDDLNEVKSVHG